MSLKLSTLVLWVLLVLFAFVQSDVYLHNPRGSNNRLDDSGRERDNNDRMFDSQNNARGGYNVGNLYYYSGSQLMIEWTNQHSCGGPNNNCDIIIQYMCGTNLRDGLKSTTIPAKSSDCQNNNCSTDTQFGMNEDYNYYMNCLYTERNQRLFTADQKLKGSSSIYTRQNSEGTRRAYECPEERDYYPYWRPTPWKDIVVMTNDMKKCNTYRGQSENTKARFACVPPDGFIDAQISKGDVSKADLLGITKESCEKIQFQGKKAEWKLIASKGIPSPRCILSPKSGDNHNGNGLKGFANTYNWIIPDDINENCVLRLRYNISTGDFPATVDSTNNNAIKIGSLVGLSDDEATNRGYVFKNNPVVQPLKTDDPNLSKKLQLALAINTAQYGRTFQDRSHRFSIKKRPAEFDDVEVYNLNVRGKRGNIVQVYPAVEYDFVPSQLSLTASDAIHIQWTGSDNNPQNNAGQGKAGTDRSNIVLLRDQNYPEGKPGKAVTPGLKKGHYGNSYPMKLGRPNKSFLGFYLHDITKLAYLKTGYIVGDTPTSLEKGKIIANIPKLEKEYLVSFDVYPNKFEGGWRNVIHFTIGSNLEKYGDRVPAVWFHADGSGGLHIAAPINGNLNRYFDTKPILLKKWSNIEICQILKDEGYLYTIKINGEIVFTEINNQAQNFNDVKVYAADPWYDTQDCSIKNLYFVNGITSSGAQAVLTAPKDLNLKELDDGGKYFDLGLRMLTSDAIGTYYYMCTRNNNFSNRSHKGKIVVNANKDDFTSKRDSKIAYKKSQLTLDKATISRKNEKKSLMVYHE